MVCLLAWWVRFIFFYRDSRKSARLNIRPRVERTGPSVIIVGAKPVLDAATGPSFFSGNQSGGPISFVCNFGKRFFKAWRKEKRRQIKIHCNTKVLAVEWRGRKKSDWMIFFCPVTLLTTRNLWLRVNQSRSLTFSRLHQKRFEQQRKTQIMRSFQPGREERKNCYFYAKKR